MISALPVDPWLVIDYGSAIIITCRTQPPAGPLQVIKPRQEGRIMEIHLCIFMLHIIVGDRVAFFHFYILLVSIQASLHKPSKLSNFQMQVGGYFTYDLKSL